MIRRFWLFGAPLNEKQNSLILLFIRLLASIMLLGHGLTKLENFSILSQSFPDPLGVGSTLSLALAIFAEVGCSILVIMGFLTRIASLVIVFNFFVAAFIIHSQGDFAQKELAVMYLGIFIFIMTSGAGMISLDYLIFKNKTSVQQQCKGNMSLFNRVFRILLSFALWYLFINGNIYGILGWILFLLTIPLMATSISGYCPAYQVFSRKKEKE